MPTTTSNPKAVVAHARRGLLLVSCAGVVWGTIGPAVQLVHEGSGLSPWTIGAYRAVAAVAALVVASHVTGRLGACRALARSHWRRVILTGLSTAAFQLLFFVAVVATGVSVATVVSLGLAPVLLLVLGGVQRRRTPSPGQILTVTTALVGLGLVSIAGGTGGAAPNTALGVLAALGSGTAYAVSTQVGAPLSREHDALTVTTATMSVAAAALIPGGLGVAYVRGEAMATSDPGSWLLLVYLGVVTMAFAYVLLFAGLRSTPSGTAVVATLLEPVTAVLIAVLLLRERPTAAVVVGTLLILAAIATLGRQVEQEPPPQ
ncbi:MAG TPA: EamA family transporter [Geminicoccaceae bacterium]|nr:EamA family transporter [Geminicoccaceae bacterium]